MLSHPRAARSAILATIVFAVGGGVCGVGGQESVQAAVLSALDFTLGDSLQRATRGYDRLFLVRSSLNSSLIEAIADRLGAALKSPTARPSGVGNRPRLGSPASALRNIVATGSPSLCRSRRSWLSFRSGSKQTLDGTGRSVLFFTEPVDSSTAGRPFDSREPLPNKRSDDSEHPSAEP